MLKIIALVVAVLLVGIVALAALKPDSFRVKRAITIKAAPETIFPLIDDLHRWTAWSPYEKKDPAMKRIFSGAASGRGAAYAWDGNNNVGEGRMEITESSPLTRIAIKLDFIRPFEGHNIATFTLTPNEDGTEVIWAMDGPTPFISKLMQVFFNMDKMIGTDFEAGLADLKNIAEKQTQIR